VVRLRIPEQLSLRLDDALRGEIKWESPPLRDTVLLKSDGFPTYHLAHVVDDHQMEVDTVIRGEEWLPSTPKHLLLFRALGWEPPLYAHVPLLLNQDKSKLSKRQNDVAAEDYIEKGYLPEALLNFLALLGWNPGTEQEVFTMKELIEHFSLERVQKAGAIFDTEKLDWLQGQWMRQMPLKNFAERILPIVAENYPQARDDSDFEKKAALVQERITFFPEAPEMVSFFYEETIATTELLANPKQKVTEELLPDILQALTKTLEGIDEKDWNEERLKVILFALAEEKEWKRGQVLWPLRAALTGKQFSPGAFEVAAVLGKEETMRRLENAAQSI
jgi:glutamyl-tRNA synthetase